MKYLHLLVSVIVLAALPRDGLAFVPSREHQVGFNLQRAASISPSNDELSPSSNASKLRTAASYIKRKAKNVLWPGSNISDPNSDAPLPPPVPFGCPFLGNALLAGNEKDGPEYFYTKASAKLGHPRTWRFYFFGQACTAVSGGDNVKAVLTKEYSAFDIVAADFTDASRESKKKKKSKFLFSPESLMFERNKKKHQFLRRLVGLAMTPSAVAKGMPNIIASANAQLENIKTENVVKGQDLAENMALDIAQRQILGIELEDDEVPKFRRKVNSYVNGVFDVSTMLPLPGKLKSLLLPAYRARKYLVGKIEDRIDQLRTSGPDETTMSAMVFAEDDESGDKLTREEVIENALILLVAGTETSASTLTSAIFLLGLHPHVWKKLVQEQGSVQSTYGDDVTKDIIDKHAPYLDAVVQETLRIMPLSGTNLRRAKETMVIDGTQVPVGQAVFPNIRLTHELDPITRVDSKLHMDPRIGFLPERWLDESTRPSADFLPFGMGPRRCIGYNLALAEIKVFLALMARRVESYDLVGNGSKGADEPILWNPRTIIPKPKDGVPFVVA